MLYLIPANISVYGTVFWLCVLLCLLPAFPYSLTAMITPTDPTMALELITLAGDHKHVSSCTDGACNYCVTQCTGKVAIYAIRRV